MIIGVLSKYRWLTSIVLIVMVDVCTFSAFHNARTPSLVPSQDKMFHFLAFLVLFLVGYLALKLDFFPKTKSKLMLILVNWIIWSAYGALLEVGQSLMSYRQGDLLDFFSDVAGMIAGTIVVLISDTPKRTSRMS